MKTQLTTQAQRYGAVVIISMLMACQSVGKNSTKKQELTVLPDGWGCEFPSNVPKPNAGQTAFDNYSWGMFIALNWPVKVGERGSADCQKNIGAPGPVVWESYKDVDEIFLEDAENPGPWNSKPSKKKILSNISIAAKKNTSVVNSVDQAVGGWLIDQSGNATYYEISANETSYDYIVTNDFYNADVVSKANNINFPDGALEIKASWKILSASELKSKRYLSRPATVQEFDNQGQPIESTKNVILGLVGLHIIIKATGYPQWVWATFEQVDNVPPKAKVNGVWVDQPVRGLDYSYFDSNATNVNQSPCNWEQVDGKAQCIPKSGITFETPNPLNRYTPIDAKTASVTSTAQAGLEGTVFQYYELVTTQRPLMPDNPSNPLGQPTPALSANTTMESYIQENSSCMNCHSMATPVNSAYKSDFSYLFKFAQKPAQ